MVEASITEPELDAFKCLICQSVAESPCLLTCNHLFCLECLN
jgi:hypothetical protein